MNTMILRVIAVAAISFVAAYGPNRASAAPPPQQERSQNQSSKWKIYRGRYFSFEYPSFMQCCISRDEPGSVAVYAYQSKDALPMIGVEFRRGFKNKESLFVQCAGLDELLRQEAYGRQRMANEYNRGIQNEFSKASSTFEGPQPDLIGGRSISISDVIGNGPYKEVTASDIWLNGILRKNGVFLLTLGYLRRDSDIWEQVRQHFAHSVQLQGDLLDANAMCR